MSTHTNGHYTWYIESDGRRYQDGEGVDCDIVHARTIGEELYRREIGKQSRLRSQDLHDHTPSIAILIARDGGIIERFYGPDPSWQTAERSAKVG